MITSLSLALIPYLNFLRRKLSIKMCHFSKYQRFQNFKPRYVLSIKYKSSHSQMFFKISVLTNLANFPEKNLCWSLFLINLQAWRPTILLKRDSNTACNFIKKRHQHRYFPAKFSILLRTPFFTKHHWWVLLKIHFKIQGIITQTFKLLLNKKK